MKLTVKQAKAHFNEESKASREYARMGLEKFSKDEARHARFFKMLSKKK